MGVLSALLALAVVVALRALDPAPVAVVRVAAFDFYQRQYLQPLAPRSPVVVVAVDGESVARLGPWPWPPGRLAALVDRIAAGGAKALAFTTPIGEGGGASATARLAAAMARLPTVLAGDGALPPGRGGRWRIVPAGVPEGLWTVPEASGNPPVLRAAAAAVGHPLVAPPGERVARRLPAVVRVGERLVPALALALWRAVRGGADYGIETAGDAVRAVGVGDRLVATDRQGALWPRFAPVGSIPSVAAAAVLAGTVPKGALAGRAVVVGPTTPEAAAATPVGPMPRAAIHALVLDRLSRGGFLIRPAWAEAGEIGMVALAGLLALTLLVVGRGGWAVAGIAFLALAPAIAATVAFAVYGVLLDAVLPTIAVLVVLFVVLEVRAVHRLARIAKKVPRGRHWRRRGGVSG